MRAIGVLVTTLNLEFLIADILEEQKNPTSITSKRTFVHKANRPSKDSTCQNKGFKHIRALDRLTAVEGQIKTLITTRILKMTKRPLKTLKLNLNLIQTLN